VPETDTPGVRLSDAIAEVRRELARSIEEGKDSSVRFRAGPIELEFDVAFETTTGGDAGVHVWVVSVGGSHEVHRTVTNHLKVTLTPVDRQGNDILIDSTGSR
jgi:Trypsin-co-occurring domain 2